MIKLIDSTTPEVELRDIARRQKILLVSRKRKPLQIAYDMLTIAGTPLEYLNTKDIQRARNQGIAIGANLKTIRDPLLQEVYLMRGMCAWITRFILNFIFIYFTSPLP